MKRKNTYFFRSCLIILIILLSDILPCYAVETGSDPSLVWNGVEQKAPDTTEDPSYVLQADQTQISFGILEQESLVPGQNIVLTNRGSEEIELIWYESDQHDCIVVDAPDLLSLNPGESCTFTAAANTSLAAGTYNAILLFGDVSDPYFEHGVQVDLSMKIIQPAPAIPVITSISISPGTVTATKNSTCSFTASVTGENGFSSEVVWSVSGQKSHNTFIDSSGILNIAADETSSALIIKAISRQDSKYTATALVSLQKSSYFLQVTADPDNGGTVHGSGIVDEGGYSVLSAAPHNGFVFDGWFLDGKRVSSNSQFVVDNLHSNRTYTAVFRPVSCRINVTVNNHNAGTATESRTVKYGESITLEAAAKDGYQFDSWTENGNIISTDTKLVLNNIKESRNLTAVFSQNKYTLSLNSSPENTGILTGQGTYDRGSNIRITAVPTQDYHFTGWTENGMVVSTNWDFTINNITRDMHLTAVFEREKAVLYTITASSSTGGTITPEGDTRIPEGSGILYTITPQSGYTINAVYADGKPAGAVSSYRFTDVRKNHTISAEFAELPKQEGSHTTSTTPTKPDNTAPSKEKPSSDTSQKPPAKGEEPPEQSSVNEMNPLTGTLQYLNTPVEEAERLIDEGSDQVLMTGALDTGDLQVTIHNDFADTTQETSANSFYDNSSVTNFGIVLDHVLSKEDKIEMLLGEKPVSINLHIDCLDDTEPPETVLLFEEKKMPGMQIGQYFEISLMESSLGDTHMITELPNALNIILNLPDHLKADNRRFYILRLHTNEDGSIEFAELTDEDNDPDTITFSTDRFSPYAIAYIDLYAKETAPTTNVEPSVTGRGVTGVILALSIFIAMALASFFIFILIRRRK